jgi:hypothetical protein
MSWIDVIIPTREDIRYLFQIAQRGVASATARFA